MPENPPHFSLERKLAAVMFTDIVGYTSLMQKDESNALRTIERHRFVIEKYTDQFNGKILHYYGDGSLSIFPSAFEAVACSLEVQKELTTDLKVPLRVGIHLGDVKVKDDAVFGDGVNMASRVESLGVAGSILITDTIYHLVRNHSEIKTVSLGNFELKNVDYPVPVYALVDDFLSVPKSKDLTGRILPQSEKSKWLLLIAVLFVLTLGAYFLGRFLLNENGITFSGDKSIAVLPFSNLSNDPEQEYFSDGIVEDVINHLVKVADLKVKSRTTTDQYKNHNKTIPEIGSELNVCYILEGSVRKEGNHVRIVAQLIDVRNDVHIWSETFDREIKDIFDIQSEIAIEITQVLETKLTPDERRHIRGGPDGRQRSTNITAYDYELRAREIWRNWNTENDLENALHYLDNAIKIDSSFARAYVLKGNILHSGMRNFGVSTQIWLDQALELADKAISIDSTLADAYLLRGNILRNQSGQSENAKLNFRKAHNLEPSNPQVMQSLGYYLLSRGANEKGAELIIKSIEAEYSAKDPEYFLRWGNLYLAINEYDKAEKYYKKAISLAPNRTEAYYGLGQLYRYLGDYKNSEETLKRGLNLSPQSQRFIDALGWTNLMKGDLDAAASYWVMYEELESQFPDESQYIPFRHRLGYVEALKGDTAEANKLMREQRKLDLERQKELRGFGAWSNGGFYYDLAATNAYLGNYDQAISWLDSAYTLGFINLWYLENDPLLSNIRQKPGFIRIKNELIERQQNQIKAFSEAILENTKINVEKIP